MESDGFFGRRLTKAGVARAPYGRLRSPSHEAWVTEEVAPDMATFGVHAITVSGVPRDGRPIATLARGRADYLSSSVLRRTCR
jgi:hypothetical protein